MNFHKKKKIKIATEGVKLGQRLEEGKAETN